MADKVEIAISDYLSDSEMRQIAVDAFREVAATKAREDFQRILDNAAYELVRREVDTVFDGGMAETVKAKAIQVIAGLSAFTVFKKPDAWCRESSVAWTHLQAAMRDAQPAIEARVNEIIASMDHDDLSELISDQIGSAILNKLLTPLAGASQ